MKTASEIVIGDRRVGSGQPPFIIAEAGINHCGELARAIEMVRAARRAGADAVKFQTFTASEFVADRRQTYTYRSRGAEVTESMLEMFQRCELPPQAWRSIKDGFSDHTQGPLASAVAVGMGAAVFEKHVTLDHDAPGPDHWFSEEPHGLAQWVQAIRMAAAMLGTAQVRPTPAELVMRRIATRSLVALAAISEGEPLTLGNIGARRPGHGLAPGLISEFLGGVAARAIRAGQLLQRGDARK